jgi:SAM-dependent methyltransferase
VRAAGDDPYADIAELYEAEHHGWDEDLELYLVLAVRAGGPVLELGCGSGRVALALADAGHAVHGIDTSEAMLAIARQKARERRLGATFAVGDMRKLSSERDFALVFCALDTLLHLQSAADLRDTLSAASRVLRPGGMLAFDIVNPAPDLLAMRDGVVRLQSSFAGRDGIEVTHFVAWDIDPETQIIETEHFYDALGDDGLVRRRRTSFPLRYLEQAEVEAALQAADFQRVEVYGSAKLDPLEPDSDRLIYVATKPDR